MQIVRRESRRGVKQVGPSHQSLDMQNSNEKSLPMYLSECACCFVLCETDFHFFLDLTECIKAKREEIPMKVLQNIRKMTRHSATN